jgi:hypothetical protein
MDLLQVLPFMFFHLLRKAPRKGLLLGCLARRIPVREGDITRRTPQVKPLTTALVTMKDTEPHSCA